MDRGAIAQDAAIMANAVSRPFVRRWSRKRSSGGALPLSFGPRRKRVFFGFLSRWRLKGASLGEYPVLAWPPATPVSDVALCLFLARYPEAPALPTQRV